MIDVKKALELTDGTPVVFISHCYGVDGQRNGNINVAFGKPPNIQYHAYNIHTGAAFDPNRMLMLRNVYVPQTLREKRIALQKQRQAEQDARVNTEHAEYGIF